MTTNFFPLVFDSINVGRHIKGSKKRYMWKFELDGKENIVDLYISKLTGKRKILINGDIKIDTRKLGAYATYPLKIGKHSIIIYEKEANVYDLRCDNLSFDTIMRKIKHKSSRDHNFSNSDSFDEYDTLSIKNMAYVYDKEHEKNKWKTNLSEIKISKTEPSNELQTPTNSKEIINQSSQKFLERQEENEPLDIMNTPSTTISFMPPDLFTNSVSEMRLDTFSMSSNPFESNSIYPPIQEAQSLSGSPKYNSESEYNKYEKSHNFSYEESPAHKISKNPFDFPQDFSNCQYSSQNQLSEYHTSSEIAYPYVTENLYINPH